MGLDIYKMKVEKPDAKIKELYEMQFENLDENKKLSRFILSEFDNPLYKNEKKMFHKFKEFVAIENIEYIDYKKTSKKYGYPHKKWYLDYGGQNSEGINTYLRKKGKKKVYERYITEWKNVKFSFKKMSCLYLRYVETDYDHGRMSKKFYKKNIAFAYNQKMLDVLNKYSLKDSKKDEWILKDNDIVWFSW